MVKLVSLTPEGKIVLTLKHGMHTYGEMRLETGLSDRWLTVKLGALEGEGIVDKRGKWYGLKQETEVSAYELSLYMGSQARRMAGQLANLRLVKAVILFGSVAQKKAGEYSDLDMIIVVDEPCDLGKEEIISAISSLESNYHFTVEPLILAEADFLDNVYANEGGIIYGVAEGFEVLVDKTGEFGKILRDRVEEIRRTHDYMVEERIWLKVK